MPLLGEDSLDRMLAAHERATSRAARRIADAGTDRMAQETRRRTPIDTNPFRHRPERPRGSARRSIRRQEGLLVEMRGGRPRYIGDVVSHDPVTRLLEFDTPPHEIRPRDPDGYLAFQSRHGWTDDSGRFHPPGTWVRVRVVQHPGTKGHHMVSLGALDAERALEEYAAPVLARWRAEVESGRF